MSIIHMNFNILSAEGRPELQIRVSNDRCNSAIPLLATELNLAHPEHATKDRPKNSEYHRQNNDCRN